MSVLSYLTNLSNSVHKNSHSDKEPYSEFFNKSLEIMLLINPIDGQIINANETACAYYGWPCGELKQKKITEINILPESKVKEEMALALSEKRNYFLFVHKLADGTERDVEVYSNPITINGRKLLNSIVHDITEKSIIENELKINTLKLNNVIFGTDAGTWEWNIKTGETIFNERWAEIIGYTLKEIEPTSIKTWEQFAHPQDLEKSNKAVQEYFEGKTDKYEIETRMKHKNGSWVWVVDRGKIVKIDDKGKPAIMCGTHVEVTLRKQKEEKLAEKMIELEKMNEYMVGRELKMAELKAENELLKTKVEQKIS